MSNDGRPGRPPHADILTPAEWRVVEGVRHGLTNPAIAKRLDVSVDAVKYHVANALQKLTMSSRRELRQWDGVRRDSLLAAEAMRRGNGRVKDIGQIARSVTDISKAIQWYRDTLGLTLLFRAGTMAFFDCGASRLMLSESEQPSAESIIYFRVADIHAAYRDLIARGADGRSSPHLIHRHDDGCEEWMAFVNDNDDRPIGLMMRTSSPCSEEQAESNDGI
jgi:DNA-binding CsgD family transcriptional regulator/catechol 2,3-dioxygenase-like lactoylglutathione lyase family enzyme